MEIKAVQNNDQVYRSLSRLVADKFLDSDNISNRLSYGPLEINDFSICFKVGVIGNSGPRGVYIKIPKADLYKKMKREIMPLADEDRRFAQEEYRSLLHLSRFWRSDDINVTFVKPLGFIEDYNAIVTESVYAKYLFKKFRQWDLAGRLRRDNLNDPMHNILMRLGTALSRFHQTSIKESEFSPERALVKMEGYCSQLRSFGIDPNFHDSMVAKIGELKGYVVSRQLTKTLKGLDVRNVLIDRGGRLFMLDPGKLKEDYREADLARFIVTCRILYWGSMEFFLRLCPDLSYEESFLRGYYGRNKRPNKMLVILIIKELLKHWWLAHVALSMKRWPVPLKSFLKSAYINPFYEREITNELNNL